MLIQAGFKIVGETSVISTRVFKAFQDVNLVEAFQFFSLDWLAKAKFGAIPILQLDRLARLRLRLRRGILRSALRSERRLVEAAGVEPASGKLPLKLLHAYPGF